MANPIIQTDRLSVIYNRGKSNETRSLENVSAKIFPQEYVIIHGSSGCGKSTLLYSIAGLQAPTGGEVMVREKKISQMNKKEKVELHQFEIGMIFQAFYLIDSLSVIDNVCLPMVFSGEEREKRKETGMKLLRRFGIAEQASKFPSQLSGGQKQRVAIARALVNNPQIILADEPVGNLDSESANNVLQILKELNENDKKTVIMVTHNDEHLHFADRVIHMKDGKIVGEEINREKRPKDAVKEEISSQPEEVSSELKLLIRTFKNFSPQQVGGLLVPYKAKQLLSYLLAELTEEQIDAAENFLKDILYRNIDNKLLEKNLDLDLNEGGAGWNKQRAKSFSKRVDEILLQSETVSRDTMPAAASLADHLLNLFDIELREEIKERLRSFLALRIENKIDYSGLQQRLDAPVALGGTGLYKSTAEKMVREVEMIMLLKYSA